MSERISKRCSKLGESVTLSIDSKAKRMKKAGKPIISYAAGEPDFPTPEHIVSRCQLAAATRSNHVYTETAGLAELREAIAEKTLADSFLKVSESQILITNGCKQAVYMACQTILDPNDEVILPTPYWTTYPESIRAAGAKVVIPATDSFYVTVDQLQSVLTNKTKAIILSSPSNPSGAVYSLESLRDIARFAKKHGIWIISDEIYQNIYYSGRVAPGFGEALPEIKDQLILVNGLSKTYAMTGWRIGWMIGPQDIINASVKLQSHICSHVSNIMQQAALEALTGPQDCVAYMRDEFKKRRDLMLRELGRIKGLSIPKPDGAFYIYPDVSAFIGRRIAGRMIHSSFELAELVLSETLVATVPGEAFGTKGHLRLSYALDETSLLEGTGRLVEFFDTANSDMTKVF